MPRVRCDKRGVKVVNFPWARPDSGFAPLFEIMLTAMVPAVPVAAVARTVGEHDTNTPRRNSQSDCALYAASGMPFTVQWKGFAIVALKSAMRPSICC